MRLLKFALFISLLPALSFAQRGGGGHGGGGGGSHASGGGGGFRGSSAGGGGFSGGAAYRGGGYGGYRGGYGYGYGRYGYGLGFGVGFGWPYYGYGYGYPYGYGYGYGGYDPGYYDYGYSGYPSGYPSGYDYGYNTGAGYGYNSGDQYNASAPPVVVNQNIATGTPGGSQSSYYRQPDYYLISFNDHTIQAAVSYSVDGDTLRYTTREGVQKTAPLSSVDLRFSEQINRDRRVDFHLPQQQAR